MMMEKSCSSDSEAMDSYVKALEEEKKKILVFERELPLSLQLVTQAIGSCRRQHVDREEILTNGPVLEEFMPLRPSNSSSSTEEEVEERRRRRNCDDNKPDWLRSVQLWKEPDLPIGDVLRKPIPVSVKRVGAGGAFHPFERENNVKGPVVVAAPASSTTETSGGEEKENEGQCSQRKARRCWSSELHRRFLNALNQLGGSRAATPKQIRDLMKVETLTNDEVKSHLQKYRLHTRRPKSGTIQSSSSKSAQTPQIVLVGGLWMPPPEYSAAAAQPMSVTAGVPLNGVYDPVAAPSELGSEHLQNNKQQSKKPPTRPLNSVGRCSGDDSSEDGERTNSNSFATASSSQTTIGSRSLGSRR